MMSSSCGVENIYWWILFMNELCYILICYVSYMLICLLCDMIHG